MRLGISFHHSSQLQSDKATRRRVQKVAAIRMQRKIIFDLGKRTRKSFSPRTESCSITTPVRSRPAVLLTGVCAKVLAPRVSATASYFGRRK